LKELIVISGNIGAGKSTFLHSFVNFLNEKVEKDVILVEEGIESDPVFKEKLSKYYEDPNFRIDFQKYLTEFRHKRLQEYPDNTILVSERGLMDDVVFSNATSLELENVNGDYITYYYDLIKRLKYDYPKVLANVYLRTDPSKCLENIKLRGREEEQDIDQLYINTLHHCHEAFLPNMAQKFNYPLIGFDFNNHTDHQVACNFIYNRIIDLID
tara:strand:+ start:1199 stop:1837 length:639 start_codon:yes stop_codon:yes gene_type:complete